MRTLSAVILYQSGWVGTRYVVQMMAAMCCIWLVVCILGVNLWGFKFLLSNLDMMISCRICERVELFES